MKKRRLDGVFPRAAWRSLGLALVLAAGGGCPSTDPGTVVLSGQEFMNPDEFKKESDGTYKLSIKPTKVTFGEGSDKKTLCLRTYNGKLTGPTLRVPISDSKRSILLDLINKLPAEANGTSHTHDGMAGFNITNLHTHGLHVSPGTKASTEERQSDNIFLNVAPGSTQKYQFDIDEAGTHAPGTHWYHPHVHGSTAVQVANGMAGALIVEGEADKHINAAQERIFVFQQIPYDSSKVKSYADDVNCDQKAPSINNLDAVKDTKITLINGLLQPRITVQPKQVERWRFIHAGVSNWLYVTLYKSENGGCTLPLTNKESIPVQQIATDGILYANWDAPQARTTLAPGYRADIIMTAPEAEGTYCLVDDRATKLLAELIVDREAPSPACATLSCNCTTAPCQGPTKDELIKFGKPVPDNFNQLCESSSVNQSVVFAQQYEDDGETLCPGGDDFNNVNCKEFDPNTPSRTLTLNETETWLIKSGNEDSHPFHMHVNPFYICPGSTSNKEAIPAHWKDTLVVSNNETNGTKVVMTYEDYTGDFVMHCHKLDHEDQGMMEYIRLQEN